MRHRATAARWGVVAALVLVLTVFVSPAAAQTLGVRVGASSDPDQFYFGGHLETEPLTERLRFRPNAEIGIGDGITVVALNFEFAYSFPSQRPWNIYLGGGPALNIVNARNDTKALGGFNILIGAALIGAAHRDGLFVEMKVGALDSRDLKVGNGYVFR